MSGSTDNDTPASAPETQTDATLGLREETPDSGEISQSIEAPIGQLQEEPEPGSVGKSSESSTETNLLGVGESSEPSEVSVSNRDEAALPSEAVRDSTTDHRIDQQKTANEPEATQFSRIKKGWEMFVQEQKHNVQSTVHRASKNESIQQFFCGAGEEFARITGQQSYRSTQTGDAFEPVALRYTRSSPLQYSASMVRDDETDDIPPPPRLDHMRRSSSTPSGFRQSSIGSALGTVPHDNRSAFSRPAQRNSYASTSDSGVRYSAFDPVVLDEGERTTIEVTDVGQGESASSPSRKSRAARVTKILNMRRRRGSGGRENPTRPPASSSTSKVSISVDEESKDVIGIPRPSPRVSGRAAVPSVSEVDDEDAGEGTGESASKHLVMPSPQYQQLDSDVDEEYEHTMRLEGIEAAIQSDGQNDSPSPDYHQFIDEASGRLSRPNPIDNSIPGVRLQVATSSPPPSIVAQESDSRTPVSQDSTQSPGTNSSSGQTTIATSTSATASSSHASALSSVSETDIEVMETNVAEKQRLLQQKFRGGRKGDGSVHSSSTTSTNTHGYLALAGSPASLRDGANLQTEHFFGENQIAVAHSQSSNSASTGSSGGSGSRGEGSVTVQTSPSKKVVFGSGSPHTMSSVANTSSSSSADEEPPPKLVSYLDRKNVAVSGEGSSLPSVSEEASGEGKLSPAKIVDYSEVVFEEAKTPGSHGPNHQPTVFRPVQKLPGDRSSRFGSRPPLSPAKGLRTPTTPPPSFHTARTDSTSPAYHQLSPPKNIIDHSTREGLSKPYAVLGAGAQSLGERRAQPMLVSPEDARRAAPYDEQGENWAQEVVAGSEGNAVYTYSENQQSRGTGESGGHEAHTYEDNNIEVPGNMVSPDRGS